MEIRPIGHQAENHGAQQPDNVCDIGAHGAVIMTTIRVDRDTFRSYFANTSISVAEASTQAGIKESPAMQRALARAAGSDGVLQGTAEVDKFFGELDRWFNTDKPANLASEAALYMKPDGATHRAVQGLRAMKGLGQTDAAAEAAKSSLVNTTAKHRDQRAATGVGTHYGDGSAFAKLSPAEQQSYLAEKTKPGATPPSPSSLTESSCIGWAMEHVGAWYKTAGKESRWNEIKQIVSDDQMRGTTLARELQKDGWKTLYNNPDTTQGVPGDNEHGYTHHVAKTQGTYYGVPVDGFATDWASDPSKLDAINKAPFFVHVARGGYHVVAGTEGQINELARNEGPHQTAIYQDPMSKIVDVYANDVYGGGDEGRARAMKMWGSGITLLPPGSKI
ncbi:MAG: hypothetical protein ACO3JL_06295 [Myxococcota bacterium]